MRNRNPKWIKDITILFILPLLVMCTSCARIPSEAPELSGELGKRIAATEKSHINLLGRFFDEKRAQADKYVFEVRLPILAERVFNNPKVESVWKEVVDSDDPQDRVRLILALGPEIQKRVNAEINKLRNPLDELEKLTKRKVRNEYLQARAINNSITSFLTSASKVERNRERLLDIVGLTDTDEVIVKAVDRVDFVLNELLDKTQTVEETGTKMEAFVKELETLADSL